MVPRRNTCISVAKTDNVMHIPVFPDDPQLLVQVREHSDQLNFFINSDDLTCAIHEYLNSVFHVYILF